MPVFIKGDHEVNVSGDEEVARFEASGYSLKKAAAKPSETEAKAPAKKAAAKPSEK